MKANFFTRYPYLKDLLYIILFIILVILGQKFVNNYIFQSFNVVGQSMEPTLYTNDKLFVNRIPVTSAHLKNKSFVPNRGDIIVFKNPKYTTMAGDEEMNLVKRVIAFAGERVVVKNGAITVYNTMYPDGFNPDAIWNDVKLNPTDSDVKVDITVPENEIFVAGDHRDGGYSYDSRTGLGTVPLYDVVGPASVRVWPIKSFTFFKKY